MQVGDWVRFTYGVVHFSKLLEDNHVLVGRYHVPLDEKRMYDIKTSPKLEDLVEAGDFIKWSNVSFKNSEEYTGYIRKIEWNEKDKCYRVWSDDLMYIELGSKYDHIRITKIIPHENLYWQDIEHELDVSK